MVGRGALLGLASLGAASLAVGLSLFMMESWFANQGDFQGLSPGDSQWLATSFFVTLAVALAVAVLGLALLYRYVRSLPADVAGYPGLGTMFSKVLSSRTDVRVGAVSGSVYALLYLVASGLFVYLPSVNFHQAFGATGLGASVYSCCGLYGTIPELTVYLIPQWSVGLQIIPLNLLFAAIIPVLVGFNMALASYTFRNRPQTRRKGWVGSIGAFVGLFTGCPTCAASFLASAMGSLGASTIAVALQPYQILFIAVSIPVLVLSPFFVAAALRRSMYAYCRV
jgi:hypothetical protein